MSCKTIKILTVFLFSFYCLKSTADEGMWIPSLLEYYNIDIMQDKGLKLNAEDIYSINQASIKDAVIIFGGGCTGVMVSPEGLLLTNHHCGYGEIQRLSSVENDYLKNGFWAFSREEELPAKGLTVRFLIKIEDVTLNILSGINSGDNEEKRKIRINQNIKELVEEAQKDTHYKAIVKPFFYDNEYYMFIYEEFTDVRLVGAPPSSIGNFGSDHDNWVWPRHTGDFSIFRVYADEDNKPADYSVDNIPYKPRKFIPISTAGVDSGDFTMIMGYPGVSTEYLISSGVGIAQNYTLPNNIKLREKRMEIISSHMKSSETINLQYAAKLKTISNAWKKWQGVIRGLKKAGTLDIKKLEEEEFQIWLDSDTLRKKQYGEILPEIYSLYDQLVKYALPNEYYYECFMATEIFQIYQRMNNMILTSVDKNYAEKLSAKDALLNYAESFFKDYEQVVDKEIFAVMMESFYKDIDPEFHPPFFSELKRKYNNDYNLFATKIFNKSNLLNFKDINHILKFYPDNEEQLISKILNDPLYSIFSSFLSVYHENIFPAYNLIMESISSKYRIYMQALRVKDRKRAFYPDANFTMRLTYGEVQGYEPSDAVVCHYQTTFKGMIEKYYTGDDDYIIPEKLLHLYESQDLGRWADKKTGELHLCFVASNHTSGGNSGSPVMNSRGHLIGLNFDRNWEGTMSDIMYNPLVCRNISVDIRYVLFIIDKFANAGYLIDEMLLTD